MLTRTNVIWKPLFVSRFEECNSNNYFEEYHWQLTIEKHQHRYQRQWATCG